MASVTITVQYGNTELEVQHHQPDESSLISEDRFPIESFDLAISDIRKLIHA